MSFSFFKSNHSKDAAKETVIISKNGKRVVLPKPTAHPLTITKGL